jgi:hypothetical protein
LVGYCAKRVVIIMQLVRIIGGGRQLFWEKEREESGSLEYFDDENDPSLYYLCSSHISTIVRYWLFTIRISCVSHLPVQLYYLYSLNCNRTISNLICAYRRLFSPGWKGEVVLTQLKVVQFILKFNVILAH